MEKSSNLQKDVKWQLWVAGVFSAIGVINLILVPVFQSVGLFEARSHWWLLGSAFILCSWLPLLLQKMFKVKWQMWIVIVFDLYTLSGIVLGSMWRLYEMGFGLDKIVHVIGGAMWAVLPYVFFESSSKEKNKLSGFWLAILLIGFSMMCGGVWEIYEYVGDTLFGSNMQYASGLVGLDALADTMQDLICDLSGSVLAVIGVFATQHFRNKNEKEKTSEQNSEEVEQISA